MLKQKFWHALFEASVLIKAINGVWETLSGFAILFLSKDALNHAFLKITSRELIEDPNDRIMNFLTLGMQHLSTGTKNFAGVYILAHGIINLFLAYNLYKERMWSFGVSLAFFSLSVVYLIYKASIHPSPFLIALIIFDIIFNYLTWHEYKYRKALIEGRAAVETD
jgi:uncharacterized membrane protein